MSNTKYVLEANNDFFFFFFFSDCMLLNWYITLFICFGDGISRKNNDRLLPTSSRISWLQKSKFITWTSGSGTAP